MGSIAAQGAAKAAEEAAWAASAKAADAAVRAAAEAGYGEAEVEAKYDYFADELLHLLADAPMAEVRIGARLTGAP